MPRLACAWVAFLVLTYLVHHAFRRANFALLLHRAFNATGNPVASSLAQPQQCLLNFGQGNGVLPASKHAGLKAKQTIFETARRASMLIPFTPAS